MARAPLPSILTHCLVYLTLIAITAADFGPFHNDNDFKNGIWGSYPRQTFLSLPGIEAPVANIIVEPRPGTSPGRHLVYTPQGPAVARAWPTILDSADMSLVWHGPPSSRDSINGAVQECNNTQYLTFWYGGLTKGGWRGGDYYLLNNKYQHVFNVTAQGNLTHADGHEFRLTPQCTAIYTSYQPRKTHLVLDGRVTDYNLDSYFQEIDLATGNVLFQWNASQHVDIQDTFWDPSVRNSGQSEAHGFDWFHINSVQKDLKGNYLVGSRHTHAVYYISGHTGDILWQLGGKRNMFGDLSNGTATDFKWQHHVRWVDDQLTKLSIYDNRVTQWHPDQRDSTSRGIIISLDYDTMEARLEHEYTARNAIASSREGSMQVMKHATDNDYNVLLGYGQEPAVTEFNQRGDVLWDVLLAPLGVNRKSPDNYRWSKVQWHGAPLTMPNIAPGPPSDYYFAPLTSIFSVRLNDTLGQPLSNDTVYFSWNGATDIASWVVLASNTTDNLNPAEHLWKQSPKSGFESSVYVGRGARYVAVLAIDKDDHVLGMSKVLDMSNGEQSGGLEMSTDGNAELSYDTRALNTLWREYRRQHASFRSDLLSFSASHVLFAVGAMFALVLLVRLARPVRTRWSSYRPTSAVELVGSPQPSGHATTPDDLEDAELESDLDREEKGLLENPAPNRHHSC